MSAVRYNVCVSQVLLLAAFLLLVLDSGDQVKCNTF